MKITIRNFRKYTEKRTFDFNDSEVNLVQGPSGSGKSTIFDAIAWCLYGKEQQIYPKNTENTNNTLVRIVIKNLKIERTKPPDFFKIIFDDGKELIEDEADAFITSFFGTKGLWYSSSYVCQGIRNPLLTLSNSQKFDLLKELTFGVSSDQKMEPSFYEEKVNYELGKYKKKISDATNKYNGYKESYDIFLKSQDLDKWNLNSSFDDFDLKFKKPLKKLKKEKSNNIEELKTLLIKYKESNFVEMFNLDLENRLSNLLEEISILNPEDQNSLINEMTMLQEKITLKKELMNLIYVKDNSFTLEELESQLIIYSQLNLTKKKEINDLINKHEKYKKNKETRDLIISENKVIEKKINEKKSEENKLNFNKNLEREYSTKLSEYNFIVSEISRINKLREDIESLFYLKEHDNVDTEVELNKLLTFKKFYIEYPNGNFREIKDKHDKKYQEFLSEEKSYLSLVSEEETIYQEKLKKYHVYNEYLKNLEELDDIFYLKIHDSLVDKTSEINRLCTIKKIYNSTKTKTPDEFKNYLEHLKKYQKYISDLDKIKKHNSEQDNIKNLKKIWELENKNFTEYQLKLEEYEKIKEKRDYLINILNYEIIPSKEIIKKEIENRSLSLNKYNCPHCKEEIFFKDGKLTELKEKKIDPQRLDSLREFLKIYDLPNKPIDVKKPDNFEEMPIYLELPEHVDKPFYICPDEYLDFDMNIELKDIDYYIESINNQGKYKELIKKTSVPPESQDKPVKNTIPRPILDEETKKFRNYNFSEINLTLEEINNLILSLTNKKEYHKIKEELSKLKEPVSPTYPNKPEYLEVNYDLINFTLMPRELPQEIYEPEGINLDLESIKLDLDDIKIRIQSIKNKKRYEELNSVVGDIKLEELQINLNLLKNKVEYNNEIISKKEHLNRKIEIIKSSFKDVPEISSISIKNTIEKLETRNKELDLLITSSESINLLYDQFIELEDKKIKLMKYLETEKILNEIKSIIMEVSSNSMEEIINGINNVSNLILSRLFDDPINIKLSPYKTLKSGDEKLQVNLKITHNNYVYDNPSSLSGGENDRISFAVTLSIAKITGSKFLLLDECMASLNTELREKSIKVLKELFPELTIIHICHEAIEGLHDFVIEI